MYVAMAVLLAALSKAETLRGLWCCIPVESETSDNDEDGSSDDADIDLETVAAEFLEIEQRSTLRDHQRRVRCNPMIVAPGM